jgi:hypothetical protein
LKYESKGKEEGMSFVQGQKALDGVKKIANKSISRLFEVGELKFLDKNGNIYMKVGNNMIIMIFGITNVGKTVTG